MKSLNHLLVLLILVSCENETKEKNTHQDSISHVVKRTGLEESNDSAKLFIPEEIKNKIDKKVIFAMADIGTWDGDYIGNTIYVLNKTRHIKRISNRELPETGNLFCTELADYHEADSIKFNAFFNYLYNLIDLKNNNKFKTPDTLDVSGGSLYYVYINVEDPGFWLSFEPESSDLTEKLKAEFDKLFQ